MRWQARPSTRPQRADRARSSKPKRMKPASLPNGRASSISLCPSCYRSQRRSSVARFARAAWWLLRRMVEGVGWLAVIGLITQL